MHNMPKCKGCRFYETTGSPDSEFFCHACHSPKWEWTKEDYAEWRLDNPVINEWTLRNVIPPFIIERHCDCKPGTLCLRDGVYV